MVGEPRNLYAPLADIAIKRLKTFEPPEGYYVAYSGGKDSDVILDLVRRSGVKYMAHYHVTTCDPPELIRHIKSQADVIFDKPEITMWGLIKKKKMPPRRNARFCCEYLKERGGIDAIVVTGVRWEESTNRNNRRMYETCFRHKQKRFLNIIIDWSTTDVWNYIKANNLSYCSLYDEGFKRLGCVLCPMNRDVEIHIQRWPRIAELWEKAIKATYNPKTSSFDSAAELWKWWLNRDSSKKVDNEQLIFFED